jgi:hypothetical protein
MIDTNCCKDPLPLPTTTSDRLRAVADIIENERGKWNQGLWVNDPAVSARVAAQHTGDWLAKPMHAVGRGNTFRGAPPGMGTGPLSRTLLVRVQPSEQCPGSSVDESDGLRNRVRGFDSCPGRQPEGYASPWP